MCGAAGGYQPRLTLPPNENSRYPGRAMQRPLVSHVRGKRLPLLTPVVGDDLMHPEGLAQRRHIRETGGRRRRRLYRDTRAVH